MKRSEHSSEDQALAAGSASVSRMSARSPASARRLEEAWRRGATLVAVLIIGLYIGWRLVRGPVASGDTMGLAMGIVASVLLLLALFYGVRRRTMSMASRWRLGRSQQWLLAHIYGSLIFLLTMMLHSGLGWPAGAMSWTLWLLSWWVVLSGLVGLFFQRTIPRLLAAGPDIEVNYDRIPALVGELHSRAAKIVSAADPAVQVLFSRRLESLLRTPRRDFRVFMDARGGRRRLEPLAHLRSLLSADEQHKLDELAQIYRTKLDLDAHYTLQSLLRRWLWLHVPASIFLFILVVAHIATVIYY